jgi:hypothetical protein
MSSTLRNQFQTRIQKGLLGAGSDSWGVNDSEELISDTPLNRYYTGVLFPQMDVLTSKGEEDTDVLNDSGENNDINEEQHEENKADNELEKKGDDKEEDDQKIINRFFPNSMGITFCVPNDTQQIQVEFSFGLYYQAKRSELKIKTEEITYQTLINDKEFSLAHLLTYEDGFLSLSSEPKGNKGGRGKERSGDYKMLDEYKKQASSEIKKLLEIVDKLLTSAWKRQEIVIIENLSLKTIKDPKIVFNNEKIKLGFYLTNYYSDKNESVCYIRLQLVNLSEKHPHNKFSNRNELLNQKSTFQTQIKVKADKFLPYHQPKSSHYDEEDKLLAFLYRDVKSYAIGHNCAAIWNEKLTEVCTTYMPHYDMKAIKNEFSKHDFNTQDFSILNDSLNLHNLSIWGKSKNEIITQLSLFLQLYKNWIEIQKNHPVDIEQNNEKQKLIDQLDSNLQRMQNNIELLHTDKVFKAFQYTNTAMLLQLAVSKDKYLHNSLIKFDADKSPFNIAPDYKYRPFQLAFLILSIGDSVNPDSDTRKNTVDLIWFPTGGGKTEAYLAVTAFVLCYRRLINPKNYQGVSVIMRYTLRLLTAQQFERASRLITALEILRKNFPDNLQKEPITIGLWIGMASTPNTITEADIKIKEISDECKKNGNPKRKNVFQIEQCIWCGEDLIKLKDDNWYHGFEIISGELVIRCTNYECFFKTNYLPIQVVDECLYKKPPSLLFATVDKFAMLSWKEHGHKFFNSLDDKKLPPDLIIQDELHLLTGALGSLVGLFESIIELLCTKNNISPKIIASTATTRNTDKQVKELYGQHRNVNLFPPSGLSYKDSFFAKEDTTSTRRYLGIMPTGKTTISTQLALLTNLLVARLENYLQSKNKETEINPYWTIVSYYNTLRDVGRMNNKIGDEIIQMTKQLQNRLQLEGWFNHSQLTSRTKELTSRVKSTDIKPTLSALENKFSMNDKGYVDNQTVDLVLATNMLSVGIDISRLNLMQINGMPRNIAEYIQASSRVARKGEGLVVITLDANRAREKSHFEHFIPFHQNIYRSVEPLSVTTFTENTIDILLTSLLVTYIRHKVGRNENNKVIKFEKEDMHGLIVFIENRFSQYSEVLDYFKDRLNMIADDWLKRINVENGCKNYNELLKKPSERINLDEESKIWVALQSLRDIDSNTFIQIQEHYSWQNM